MSNRKNSRRSITGVLAALLIALLVGACGDTTPATLALPEADLTPEATSAAPTTAQTIVNSNITFFFDASVSKRDRDLIQQGVEMARKALGEVGTVRIESSPSVSTRLIRYGRVLGRTTPDGTTLFTAGQAWKRSPDQEHLATVIHEYYHLVQFNKAGKRAISYQLEGQENDLFPLWLVEGSAEYQGYRVAGENKKLTFEKIRDLMVAEVKKRPFKLEHLESWITNPNGDPYSTGFLATELLVANYGGQDALIRYWQLIGKEMSYEEAFQEAFKISPAEFSRQFEQHRARNFPVLPPQKP